MFKNFLIMPKKFPTDALKTASKRVIQKTAEATGHLIGNKIADKVTKASKTASPKNNSQTNEEEILKERYTSLEPRQIIINYLRLKEERFKMTQYNTLNIKLSNSQLIKLKSAIKKGTEVTLDLSSNLIGSSNDETNFPHKLLLTDQQVSKIRKAFPNGSLANIKFLKTQLSKNAQSGGLAHNFLDLLLHLVKTIAKIIIKANVLSKKKKRCCLMIY